MRSLIAAVAIILVSALSCGAQFLDCASLERANQRLCGRIIDYTANHGADRRLYSPILGQWRDLYVYVPPGYTPARAYPLVLYFHLAFVDEHVFAGTRWIEEYDQMIRTGIARPAVVACVDGTIDGRNRINAPHSLYVNGVCGRFEDYVLLEVLPFLEHCFSIRPDRESHAIFGVSAGGFGGMSMAIRHRDRFGVVATLAAPLNLRYTTCDGDYFEDFNPATYRWKTEYDPDEIVGRFYFGLKRVPARRYMEPVFGSGPAVPGRVMQENPADLLFSTRLQPGQLTIYVNYGGRDNWNFDAQNESFIWLAQSLGIALDVDYNPMSRHDLRYFRTNHRRAYYWLGQHLPPPLQRGAMR
jgi:hypothetical protein